MLLGAAEALMKLGNQANFDGTVYFIFQPAEEHEGGGRVMVEEGLFERFPMQMVFGMHNWPGLPVGSIAAMEGPIMAGADRFEITITARGAHAAMPHQGTDAILAGSALIQALQSLVSRATDPQDAAVVSVTRFHAGHADNILPEQAVLGGTVRSFRPELQDALEQGMARICNGIETTHRVRIELEYSRGYPPTINAPEPTFVCREVARQVVGGENVLTHLKPSMGAEDFSYLSSVVPGCYVWLGNGPGEGGCMLHSPHYDFNDAIIETGIRYWVRLTEKALAPEA
jgi:hippurate hydrolase